MDNGGTISDSKYEYTDTMIYIDKINTELGGNKRRLNINKRVAKKLLEDKNIKRSYGYISKVRTHINRARKLGIFDDIIEKRMSQKDIDNLLRKECLKEI